MCRLHDEGLAVALVVGDVLARKSCSACTIAHPMRCVKEILPPRARRRWLFTTIRLSIISFAGIVRTLVAVGTLSDASMFDARVFAIPRSGVATSSWVSSCSSVSSLASAGIGCGSAGARWSSPGSCRACRRPGRERSAAWRRRTAREQRPRPERRAAREQRSSSPERLRQRGPCRLRAVVALEHGPPRLVDRGLVGDELLVQLVDEPLVRPEFPSSLVVPVRWLDTADRPLSVD